MPTGLWRRFRPGDRLSVGVLTAVATGTAILPTSFGRPIMNGDNLIQNYPLRVLVGQIVRDGHLPLWDAAIWSGTPLLAAWNAGAAFPGTWLFAILPGIWAWAINLMLMGLCATLGMYVFLRRQPVGPAGAFIGSATFAFTGFMSGQSAHFGLVLGTSLLPFLLIGIDEIARRLAVRPLRDLLGPVLLLSAAAALVVLAGEPRAISNDAIVVGVYSLAWCWRSPRHATRLLLVFAAAASLALALSAVQWLPGLQFLQASERGAGGYQVYAAGSLSPSWGVFFLLPYLLGGNGNFGLPTFAGPLNLPELSMGVGILPLVAFVALLPAALRRHSPNRLGVWYILAIGGLVLALGTYTPFGHVLWHVPLFGGQRLQNRNIAITDFALAVLVAYWADRLVGGHERAVAASSAGLLAGSPENSAAGLPEDSVAGLRAGLPEDSVAGLRAGLPEDSPRDSRAGLPAGLPEHFEARTQENSGEHSGEHTQVPPAEAGADTLAERVARWASALPALAVLVVVAIYLADPIGLERRLDVIQLAPDKARQLLGYLVPACALAVAVGVFALAARHLSPRVRERVLVALAVADISFLAANGPFALAPAVTIAKANSATAQLAALTGSQGRYLFYDPYFYVAPSTQPIAEELGFFDLGILHHIASVQGYGSVVSELYQAVTTTHQVGNFDLGGISGTTANVLDLRALLTSPLYLAHPLPDGAAIPILTERGPQFSVGPGEKVLSGEAEALTGPWFVLPGTDRMWFLPRIVQGPSATLVLDPTVRPQARDIGVSFVDLQGRSVSVTARVRGTRARAVAPAGFDAVQIRVTAPVRGLTIVLGGVVIANRTGSGRQLLDGLLQTALSAPHWRFATPVGPLPAFVNTESRGPAWVLARDSSDPDAPLLPDAIAATTVSAAGEEMRTVVTTPQPGLLVRSTAYAPDWYAEIQPASGGPAHAVAVTALGIVQAVPVPAGRSVVTWVYRPATARIGLWLTAGATLVFLALAVFALRRRRAPST